MHWKNILAGLLALLMAVQAVPAAAAAPAEPESSLQQAAQRQAPNTYHPYPEAAYDLLYRKSSDGTVTIVGTTGDRRGPVLVPDTIYGAPVTAIGPGAFGDRNQFKGYLYLPDSIETIGDGAFSNCSGFNEELLLPKNLRTLGKMAFDGCSGFTGSLTIPDRVESIGMAAFEGCSGFTGTITIPASAAAISDYAFAACGGSGFRVAAANPAYAHWQGLLVTKDQKQILACPTGISGAVPFPPQVQAIRPAAFSGCRKLTGSLHIPQTVGVLGARAFQGCTGLDGTLSLPQGLESIPLSCFENCSSLTGTLLLPRTLKTIGNGAFQHCKGLTGDLQVPEGVEQVDHFAFYQCSGFDGMLLLPDTLREAGDFAFSGCGGLTGTASLPASLTSIRAHTFSGLGGSGFEVRGTNPLLQARSGLLLGESGTQVLACPTGIRGSLTLPDTITTISAVAFTDCHLITEVFLGEQVQTVESFAFTGCDRLRSVYFAGDAPKVTPSGSGASFRSDVQLYYHPDRSGWWVQNGLWQGYRTAPIQDYSCTLLNGGEIVVNGSGRATAILQLLGRSGQPAADHTMEVVCNGTRIYRGVTDKNGVFLLDLPETKTAILQISAQDVERLHGAEQRVQINYKARSYSTKWEGAVGLEGEISAGPSAGVSAGAASVQASLAKLAAKGSITGTMSLEDSYEQGQRDLELSFAMVPAAGISVKSGLQASLPIIDLGVVNGGFGLDVNYIKEYGLKLEHYDPKNLAQQVQLGNFLLQIAMAASNSVWTTQLLNLLGAQAHNQFRQANVICMEAGASLGSLKVNGQETGFFDAGAKTNLTYEEQEDFLADTYTRTAGVTMDLGAGFLKDWLMGCKDYVAGAQLQNSLELSTVTGRDGAIKTVEVTTYDNGRADLGFDKLETEDQSVLSFDEESSRLLTKSEPYLRDMAAGKIILPDTDPITQAVNWIDEHRAELQGDYSRSHTIKKGGEIHIPVGLEAGLGLEVSLDALLAKEQSYETENGVMICGTRYAEAVSDMTPGDLPDKTLFTMLQEPMQAAASALSQWLGQVWGSIQSGVTQAGATVQSGVSRWWAEITAGQPAASLQSYAILCVEDARTPDENAGVSATLGEPYQIAVYADESRSTLVENRQLAAHPVDLTLQYSPAMLQAAGAGAEAEVRIYWFDPARNLYVCQPDCVQNRTELTVTVPMKQNGEYILAVDSAAPLISDFSVSDHTAKPVITAFCSDLSGISEFRFCLDGREVLNESGLSGHYEEQTGLFTYAVETPLTAGTHRASFEAADGLGNRTRNPVAFTFTVDNRPPVIREAAVDPEADGFTVTCLISEDQGLNSVCAEIRQGDRLLLQVPMFADMGDLWIGPVEHPAGQGKAQVTIVAVDEAGNRTRSEPMKVQLQAPVLPENPTLTWQRHGSRLQVRGINPGERAISGLLICAAYEADGRLRDTACRYVALAPRDRQDWDVDWQTRPGETIRLFLVDANQHCIPLTDAE